jgi:hypothetical protein
MATSSCTSCYRRKLKCDRLSDGCSSCAKAKLPCIYKPSSPGERRGPGKRGPYKKHSTAREKELEHILQELQHRVDATNRTTSSASWTSEQLDPSMMNTVAAASTGPEATPSVHQVDLGLMLENVEEVGMPCPLPQEGSDPIFVEAAMLASVKPTPYISESSTLYLWHVFTDRVEPMTRLVHVPSFTPIVLAAARNGGWMADKAARMLLTSILFAAVSVMDEDDGTAPDDLCTTTLRAALRAQIDDMLSDPSMDISPSLYSLQAIALLLVGWSPLLCNTWSG